MTWITVNFPPLAGFFVLAGTGYAFNGLHNWSTQTTVVCAYHMHVLFLYSANDFMRGVVEFEIPVMMNAGEHVAINSPSTEASTDL